MASLSSENATTSYTLFGATTKKRIAHDEGRGLNLDEDFHLDP